LAANQIGRHGGKPIIAVLGPAKFYLDVATTFTQPGGSKALAQRAKAVAEQLRGPDPDIADGGHRRLRPRR
jgi:hypothetical protein